MICYKSGKALGSFGACWHVLFDFFLQLKYLFSALCHGIAVNLWRTQNLTLPGTP